VNGIKKKQEILYHIILSNILEKIEKIIMSKTYYNNQISIKHLIYKMSYLSIEDKLLHGKKTLCKDGKKSAWFRKQNLAHKTRERAKGTVALREKVNQESCQRDIEEWNDGGYQKASWDGIYYCIGCECYYKHMSHYCW
jgi:hypothetical protein